MAERECTKTAFCPVDRVQEFNRMLFESHKASVYIRKIIEIYFFQDKNLLLLCGMTRERSVLYRNFVKPSAFELHFKFNRLFVTYTVMHV